MQAPDNDDLKRLAEICNVDFATAAELDPLLLDPALKGELIKNKYFIVRSMFMDIIQHSEDYLLLIKDFHVQLKDLLDLAPLTRKGVLSLLGDYKKMLEEVIAPFDLLPAIKRVELAIHMPLIALYGYLGMGGVEIDRRLLMKLLIIPPKDVARLVKLSQEGISLIEVLLRISRLERDGLPFKDFLKLEPELQRDLVINNTGSLLFPGGLSHKKLFGLDSAHTKKLIEDGDFSGLVINCDFPVDYLVSLDSASRKMLIESENALSTFNIPHKYLMRLNPQQLKVFVENLRDLSSLFDGIPHKNIFELEPALQKELIIYSHYVEILVDRVGVPFKDLFALEPEARKELLELFGVRSESYLWNSAKGNILARQLLRVLKSSMESEAAEEKQIDDIKRENDRVAKTYRILFKEASEPGDEITDIAASSTNADNILLDEAKQVALYTRNKILREEKEEKLNFECKSILAKNAGEEEPWLNSNSILAYPLYLACKSGNDSLAELILSNDYDIKLTCKNQNDFLSIACRKGHTKIVEVLFSHGVNINYPDYRHKGGDALALACEHGHLDLAEILLTKMDANVAATGENRNTPLHLACAKGYENIVELLLQHHASVNAESADGNTPLFYACLIGHVSLVKLLLASGAEVTKKMLGSDNVNEGIKKILLDSRSYKEQTAEGIQLKKDARRIARAQRNPQSYFNRLPRDLLPTIAAFTRTTKDIPVADAQDIAHDAIVKSRLEELESDTKGIAEEKKVILMQHFKDVEYLAANTELQFQDLVAFEPAQLILLLENREKFKGCNLVKAQEIIAELEQEAKHGPANQ